MNQGLDHRTKPVHEPAMPLNNPRNIRLLLPLLAVMFALLVSGAFTFVSFKTENKLRVQTILSTNILSRLRQIEVSILDAETGQRGYILTLNPNYLAPYENGPRQYRANFDALSALLSEIKTDTQKSALDTLSSLAEKKFDELASTVRLTDAGRRIDALELINSDVGKQFMVEIRALIAELEAEEQSILEDAILGARAAHEKTVLVLMITAIFIAILLGFVWYLFSRAVKLDRTEELLKEVQQHRDRNDLLAQELSHRVKNLFGIIASIVRMTGRGETDVPTVLRKITERIQSLSRAHALTTTGTDNDTIALSDLIETVLEPYADEGRVYSITGGPLMIPESHLTPLGLILHELVTNAVKYGAWRSGDTTPITIHWTIDDPDEDQTPTSVDLIWSEAEQASAGAAHQEDIPPPQTSGFGSKMMMMSAQQLGGTLEKDLSNGFKALLRFKLNPVAVNQER